MPHVKNGAIFKCEYCGKEFYRSKSQIKLGHNHYCCKDCVRKAATEKRKGKWYTCPICGKEFYRQDCYTTKSKVLYCSRECFKAVSSPRMTKMNEELNPTRMTEATKEQLRKARTLPAKRRKSYPKKYGRHEHRIVAERMLGRPLRKGEVVHHINRDKQDNRPENLMVFSSQSEHAKWHKENDKKGVMPNEVHTARVPAVHD